MPSKILLKLSKNFGPVPFNYQHKLIQSFHSKLPDNLIHNDISLYSLSWLRGAVMRRNNLQFPEGATMTIGFHEDSIAQEFIINSIDNFTFPFGMKIEAIQFLGLPDFSIKESFFVDSPVLVKLFNQDTKQQTHLLYDDPRSTVVLTKILRTKCALANIPNSDDLVVSFDQNFQNPKTKLVDINGVKNRANYCPIIIQGSKEVKEFAWFVGIGHCTGAGFGAIV